VSAKSPRGRQFIRSEIDLDIVESMDHEGMFRQWFSGPSWDNWKAILRAAFGLPMTASEVEFFRSVAERSPPPGRVRELWIVAGRRAGKDSIASLIAAYAAVFSNFSIAQLRPGERALVQCLAVDRDQSKIVLGYIRSYFDFIPPLRSMITRRRVDGFSLFNDVDVSVAANNYRAVRGRTVLCSIFDECAYWQDERSARPDSETYAAVRPSLATLPGSMLIGISTPYRKSGLLWSRYKSCYGIDDPDVLVVKAPSLTLNPTLDRSIVEKALADDPQAASSEWLAEFRSDISSFIDPEVIEAAVVRGRRELPATRGVSYVAFCDPSGGSSDSMTLAIAHRDGERVIVDCLREVRPPFSPDAVCCEFAAVLKSYGGLATVSGDKYAGCWPAERFSAYGVRYEPSEMPKSDIYRDCLPLLNAQRAELLDHPRLISQFSNLERRVARGGKDSIDHAPNAHDDLANAVAGALVLAAGAAAGLAVISESQWSKILSDVDAMPRYRWSPSFPETTPRF
jgi:hypothetical protein